MDTKNNLLKEAIYPPTLYQNLLSIIVIHQNSDIINPLQKICNQVYQPVEIIIIDNSSNESYNIIENYITNNNLKNVQLYHTNRKNLYECINIGLTKSKGNYIAFQFSQDESSHLRFLYQIDQLNKKEHIYNPFMSLCLSYSENNTFVSPSSMCITRFVLQKLGYFDHELYELCFEEYVWRYLYIFENLYYEDKDINFLKDNEFKTIKVLHKTLYISNILKEEEIKDNHKRKKYDKKHQNIEFRKKDSYYINYKQNPFSKTTYLSQVNNVLTGHGKESRITLVFFTNGFNYENIQASIKSFYETFRCTILPTIVCHYGSEETIDKLSCISYFKDATFLKYNSFSDSFYNVINDYIETPHMFLLQDQWKFNSETIFHPLSYIIDIIEKHPGLINSLRFNSKHNKISDIDKLIEKTDFFSDPEFVYTSGITNEPQILDVRYTKKFKLPFVNREVKGDGVSDQIRKKYNNLTIAMKLRSCLYGSINYPPTSHNLYITETEITETEITDSTE